MKHKSTPRAVESCGLHSIPTTTLNGMADGRIQMAEEHTIVSAAKGNRLQLIPLIAVLAGLGILFYRFWLNTSALYAPFYALMACGVVGALIQLLVAITTTCLYRRKVIAIVDATVIIITLLIILFGDYIVCSVLKLPVVSYAWSPGTQINTVATILSGAVVTLLAFWEQRKIK